MAVLHEELVASRAKRLTALRKDWPSDKPAWDLLIVMLDEVWGINKNALQMDNVCAFHSWRWVCAAEDFAPMRELYSELFEELTTTVQMAQEEGTVPKEIAVAPMIDVMAAAFFHGIQEARISRDAFIAQNADFMAKVHLIFRVPYEGSGRDAA